MFNGLVSTLNMELHFGVWKLNLAWECQSKASLVFTSVRDWYLSKSKTLTSSAQSLQEVHATHLY